ncbi:MAG TPA: hypothetical protein VMP86_08520 [Candidatus Binatia bacterium]|nr:hypothetical protein [Candidatus Binatia bacterium]
MPPLGWLLVAVAAGVVAYLAGWPAWQVYRSREGRETNRERYLAWRGRAVRGQPPARAGMSGDERRRIAISAGLVVVALFALVAFFATS